MYLHQIRMRQRRVCLLTVCTPNITQLNTTFTVDYATLAENTNKCIEKFKQLTNTIRQKYATLFDITDGLLVPREERALMQRLLYSESQEAFAKEKAAFQQQIQQQASRPT